MGHKRNKDVDYRRRHGQLVCLHNVLSFVLGGSLYLHTFRGNLTILYYIPFFRNFTTLACLVCSPNVYIYLKNISNTFQGTLCSREPIQIQRYQLEKPSPALSSTETPPESHQVAKYENSMNFLFFSYNY